MLQSTRWSRSRKLMNPLQFQTDPWNRKLFTLADRLNILSVQMVFLLNLQGNLHVFLSFMAWKIFWIGIRMTNFSSMTSMLALILFRWVKTTTIPICIVWTTLGLLWLKVKSILGTYFYRIKKLYANHLNIWNCSANSVPKRHPSAGGRNLLPWKRQRVPESSCHGGLSEAKKFKTQ